MIQEDLLVKVIDKINQLKIPYMLTGGIATIFYGRPRITHDFDIVVEFSANHVPMLIESFRDEFYINAESIQEALDTRSMFNIIHLHSGIKVDFWMLQDDQFDRKRFERRGKHIYSGREIVFSSAEDIVLKKLAWFKETEIEKHIEDVLGILEIQETLDLKYIREWAEKLNIKNLLDQLLGRLKNKYK
jgi:hypothetical protein